MKLERNAPCPCGSGVKFKRCCGSDPAARQALEDRIEARAEAVALPALTPLLRPASEGFDAWARTTGAADEPLPAVLDAGVEAMGAAERERLARECERVCGPPGRASAARSETKGSPSPCCSAARFERACTSASRFRATWSASYWLTATSAASLRARCRSS